MFPQPLRILNAIALALFITGAVVGAVGFSSAESEAPADVPASLSLPEPRIGDRGQYNVALVRQNDGSVETVRDDHVLFEFEWLPPEIQRDHEGRAHLVNRLLEVPWGINETDERQRYAPPVWAFDATDQTLISYSYLDDEVGDGASYSSRQTMILNGELHTAPCGFDLRGREDRLDLTGRVAPFWHCSWEAYWTDDRIPFVARGAETLDGLETVFLTRATRGSAIHLWLAPEVPYPVKMAVEDQRDPGLFHVIRLVSFERGGTPLADGPQPTLPDAPELAYSSPRPWGMDDGGVDHDFPLSRAHEEAMQHPEADDLRRYLGDHPEAFVVDAWHDRYDDDGQVRHTWRLVWDDGGDRFAAGVALVPAESSVPVPGLFASEPTVAYESTEPAGRYRHYMDRDALERHLPDGLPTPDSLMARWQAYATEGHSSHAPDTWGFSLACMDSDCKRAHPSFEAGYRERGRSSQQPVPILPPDGERHVNNRSLLEVQYDSDTGTDWTLRESTSVEHTGTGGAAPAGDPDPTPAGLTHYDPPLWGFPPNAVVAGAGAAAALVAVVYLLWPALKSAGALGLFTRVERHQLLDNPLRRRILAAVEEEPGIHFQRLVRATGAANGTLEHHLRKLVDAGLVVAVHGSGHTCHFAAGQTDRRAMAAAPVLRSQGARRILAAVQSHPGTSPAEIARQTALSPQSVHYHLRRLESVGLIARRNVGRGVTLEATKVSQLVT